MAASDDHDDDFLKEDAPPNGARVNGGGNVMDILTRVELDLAYFSEKLLNLEILLMDVAGRANDIESLVLDNNGVSDESAEKAFKFDILSGILDSEVKELDSFMTSLQMEIWVAHEKISDEESSEKMQEKLHHAEMSLKQFQDLVADIRRESVKFENAIYYIWSKPWTGEDGGTENGHFSFKSTKWKMQTEDQQRHVLQMLEKSLARELDLEKKLSDSRSVEEELKLKVRNAERESYCLEESIDMILERTFEAENASMLFRGISKELIGSLNAVQFDLNASMLRESEMRSKLQNGMMELSAEESSLQKLQSSHAEPDNIVLLQENGLKARLKEAEDRCTFAGSEVSSLREKVLSLEEQLKGSNNQLLLSKASVEASQEEKKMLHSELSVLENVIKSLKETNTKTESRAESAEAQCSELIEANMKLKGELQVLKHHGSEKINFLERKLKESDTQLEHAKASVEAIVEQQNLLKSTMGDMEHMIEDLKSKVSKAESRAENAESKCTVLTRTNLEVNEELGFVRNKVEMLENSLSHADLAKVSTAKDIGMRTKIIVDLVRKLALEREQLHLQISALTRKNKILVQKYKRNDYAGTTTFSQKGTDNKDKSGSAKLSEEPLTESSSTNTQVKSVPAVSNDEIEMETTVSADDSSVVDSSLGTVRTIEPTQLNWKYLFAAVLVFLVSYVVYYVYQEESTVA
ncbi:WPP domain-interacting tail-anchored protein 1-like [Typha latifolia]|uniref:WPP domain-interacting tail-anchored protein 1-like n=1 Tax=Typha latifolia TaxID=4733 RepID=UPI003C2D72C2